MTNIKAGVRIELNIHLSVISFDNTLTALLSPQNIDSNAVIKDLSQTIYSENELKLAIELWVLKNNKFDYIIKPVSLNTMFNETSNENYEVIVLDFFKAYLIRSYQIPSNPLITLKNICTMKEMFHLEVIY